MPYLGLYAGSKFALEALTNALRLEVRHWGISVSIVEPGSVATPIWEKSRATADAMAEDARPSHSNSTPWTSSDSGRSAARRPRGPCRSRRSSAPWSMP